MKRCAADRAGPPELHAVSLGSAPFRAIFPFAGVPRPNPNPAKKEALRTLGGDYEKNGPPTSKRGPGGSRGTAGVALIVCMQTIACSLSVPQFLRARTSLSPAVCMRITLLICWMDRSVIADVVRRVKREKWEKVIHRVNRIGGST